MEYLEKIERETDTITSAEQKDHVITKYLLEKELVFKIDPFDKKAVIKKVLEEGEKIIIQVANEENLPKEKSFILYTILAKYIQLECILLQKLENSLFIIKVERLAIAKKNRETQRFQVEVDDMYVTNIVSSKTVIEANMLISLPWLK
ncbi:PF07614 domain protein [Leptospira noguchii str. 2001034031]|uniref:PF07614 domain protein n=1 Tax=Leptospira noguchii str. 2001034031 TaxID=1193053 RepID=M6YFU7_9LEPT|nr:PF07614 domain protein [Leptospira noguchii str. 2001034031]